MAEFPHPPVNPWTCRYPNEAAIIGRIVIAFSELEVQLSLMLANLMGPPEAVLRMLYTPKQSGFRVEAALAGLMLLCRELGIEDDFNQAKQAVYACRTIRNRYAHCNWGDDQAGKAGLFFADYEESAKDLYVFTTLWKHIDVPLLEQQDMFFSYTNGLLIWLNEEIKCRLERRASFYPKREPLPVPPPHNPEIDHVPPWLQGEHRKRHIARAQEIADGGQRRTPGFLALEDAREEKRLKKAKHDTRCQKPER